MSIILTKIGLWFPQRCKFDTPLPAAGPLIWIGAPKNGAEKRFRRWALFIICFLYYQKEEMSLLQDRIEYYFNEDWTVVSVDADQAAGELAQNYVGGKSTF